MLTGQSNRTMTKEERELADKPWNELTDSQKIERLVMVVRGMEYQSNTITNLQAEVNWLREHSHSTDGKVVVPLATKNPFGGILTPYDGKKLNSLY